MTSDWLSMERMAEIRQQEIQRETETWRRMKYGELDTPHWRDHRRESEPWLYVTALPPDPRSTPVFASAHRGAAAAARWVTCCGRSLVRVLPRRHRALRSFESEVRQAGGVVGCLDAGYRAVPLEKVVGSVGRADSLRSDFFRRNGPAVTGRYSRIETAFRQGKELPALELYRVRQRRVKGGDVQPSEYYVVDGHHRVAVARKLGVSFLDAHVVEYKVADDGPSRSPTPSPGT